MITTLFRRAPDFPTVCRFCGRHVNAIIAFFLVFSVIAASSSGWVGATRYDVVVLVLNVACWLRLTVFGLDRKDRR